MTRTPTYSPTVRRRRLGMLLRTARDAAGLSSTAAASRLGVSRASLNKIETAETQRVRSTHLDDMITLYGIPDQEAEELHALAKAAKVKGWWWKYRDVFGSEPLPDFEAEASHIRTFQPQAIPGLLQTPEYAEAVFRGGRYTSAERLDRLVEARMTRREILHRHGSPPRLWAVIDEAVLRRPVGGPEVMRSQMDYLLHIGVLQNIDIQVLPFDVGAHAAMTGAFTILEFPEPLDPTIVYTDTVGSGQFEEDPEEVTRYIGTFGDVQGAAASTVMSAQIIEDIRKEGTR
ncbi:helix-turn-helix domain-containing protein [Nocardiopsis ganjiahuensis]|uniref:helix-turn-helix domain-containing protein n=1 Tax=Nocardiopsis ganjiahuensis TaxID=239984 RepID=UPI000476D2E2|nr:helix-turn-helix transcriptional regulator [Nocardiopsis ganjiahuensis]